MIMMFASCRSSVRHLAQAWRCRLAERLMGSSVSQSRSRHSAPWSRAGIPSGPAAILGWPGAQVEAPSSMLNPSRPAIRTTMPYRNSFPAVGLLS
jgi:hypothetical protein